MVLPSFVGHVWRRLEILIASVFAVHFLTSTHDWNQLQFPSLAFFFRLSIAIGTLLRAPLSCAFVLVSCGIVRGAVYDVCLLLLLLYQSNRRENDVVF